MATIRDLAKRAGVSPATVSRILNYDSTLSVSDETRKRVFQAAEDLNYTKHLSKKFQRYTGKTAAIVLWCEPEEEINDLYYYSIRLGITERLTELGLKHELLYAGASWEKLDKYAGVIVIGSDQYSADQLAFLRQLPEAVVFVDGNHLRDGFPSVYSDFRSAVEEIVDHFVKTGRTKIGMLAGDLSDQFDKENLTDFRFQDFKRYVQAKGLYQPDWIFVGAFTSETGYEAVKQAWPGLTEKPDSLLVANDAMAIGALKAFRELHVRVPEDLSMISFNDTTVAQFANPALSSVKVETNEMGKRAAEVLLNRLEQPDRLPYALQLLTKLILRQSSIN
ncbi:MAG: LacI family DNA-binding transcriptional regulator [Lactobacillus sp.]|jgi:LacI family transcriptional regulator